MTPLLAISRGFFTSASLIVAIGAQNAFVLKQGATRQFVFITALICSVLDATLITLGVSGFGTYITETPLLMPIAKWGGALFLTVYAGLCIKAAIKSTDSIETATASEKLSLKALVITLLSISLLNPHVYLDTVILLGSIASHLTSDEKIYFTFGAICASFFWFFTLAFGSKKLSHILCKPKSWKILNMLTGITMLIIASTLILN